MPRNTNNHSFEKNLSTTFEIMRTLTFAQQNFTVKFSDVFFLKLVQIRFFFWNSEIQRGQ